MRKQQFQARKRRLIFNTNKLSYDITTATGKRGRNICKTLVKSRGEKNFVKL